MVGRWCWLVCRARGSAGIRAAKARGMDRDDDHMLVKLWGAVCRFIVGVMSGAFVSVVIFVVVTGLEIFSFWEGPWKHSLWIVPLVWGALAVLWFQQMLEMAKRLFEGIFALLAWGRWP